jgi:alcohol dehydrogenase class IV
MRHQARKYQDRLVLIAKAQGQDPMGLSDSKQALSAADRVEELVKNLRLSKKLSDYGIEKDDLPSIAREAAGPEEYSMALEVLQAIL